MSDVFPEPEGVYVVGGDMSSRMGYGCGGLVLVSTRLARTAAGD
jgi:hypothetical protein